MDDDTTWQGAMEARMERHEARMEELTGYIETIDTKLVAIGRQNAALSEMVELLSGQVTAVVDHISGQER